MADLKGIIISASFRHGMVCPDAITAHDLLGVIYGMCAGVGDPSGRNFLGSFPRLVEARIAKCKGDSWQDALWDYCDDKSLSDLASLIVSTIEESNQIDADVLTIPPHDRENIEPLLLIMADVFQRPTDFLPRATCIREIVAYLHGIMISRNPPHGYVNGLGHFASYVCKKCRQSEIMRLDRVMIEACESIEFHQACHKLANWIREYEDRFLCDAVTRKLILSEKLWRVEDRI